MSWSRRHQRYLNRARAHIDFKIAYHRFPPTVGDTMAKTKKKTPKPRTASTEAHRVNITLTPEEYELLSNAAAQVKPLPLPPTVMAKTLVMRALTGEDPFASHDQPTLAPLSAPSAS